MCTAPPRTSPRNSQQPKQHSGAPRSVGSAACRRQHKLAVVAVVAVVAVESAASIAHPSGFASKIGCLAPKVLSGTSTSMS